MKVTLRSRETRTRITVVATSRDANGRESFVGELEATRYARPPFCMDSLERLREFYPEVQCVYVVNWSNVTREYQGTGLGIEMYLLAAEIAASLHGALGSEADCQGGYTSMRARRVWDSRRFNEEVARVGKIVYWTGGQKRRT